MNNKRQTCYITRSGVVASFDTPIEPPKHAHVCGFYSGRLSRDLKYVHVMPTTQGTRIVALRESTSDVVWMASRGVCRLEGAPATLRYELDK